MVCFEAKCIYGTEADVYHNFQLARPTGISHISATATPRSVVACKVGFFEPTFCQPSMSLKIHSQNQTQLIEIFDQFLFFGKIQLIAFNQQTNFPIAVS